MAREFLRELHPVKKFADDVLFWCPGTLCSRAAARSAPRCPRSRDVAGSPAARLLTRRLAFFAWEKASERARGRNHRARSRGLCGFVIHNLIVFPFSRSRPVPVTRQIQGVHWGPGENEACGRSGNMASILDHIGGIAAKARDALRGQPDRLHHLRREELQKAEGVGVRHASRGDHEGRETPALAGTPEPVLHHLHKDGPFQGSLSAACP
jgi:hypothetical protein